MKNQEVKDAFHKLVLKQLKSEFSPSSRTSENIFIHRLVKVTRVEEDIERGYDNVEEIQLTIIGIDSRGKETSCIMERSLTSLFN